MVVESPSETNTSFDLTPGYRRDGKEIEKESKFAPLRESR
jgi:hypothetical protein